MLVGDQIDDAVICDAIESTGARLVMDDLSMGSKMYWEDVDLTRDPIEGIAERYLKKLKLPTTFVDAGNNYQESLNTRFGHMKRHIAEFKVDGVILFIYKYCDPYGFEVPAVKELYRVRGDARSLPRRRIFRVESWQGEDENRSFSGNDRTIEARTAPDLRSGSASFTGRRGNGHDKRRSQNHSRPSVWISKL